MKKYISFAIIVISLLIFASGVQAATVMIDPATQISPAAGGTFTVNVKVEDVAGLYGCTFDLVFDNTALKVSAIAEGEFLGSDGSTAVHWLVTNGELVVFGQDTIPGLRAISPDDILKVNAAGLLSVQASRFFTNTNVDGTGNLAKVTFEVLQAKNSTLTLQNVELGGAVPDADPQVIPADVENGVVEAAAGIKGDLNKDGKILVDDAITALGIVVLLITPDDYQKWASDMNGDGNTLADDVILILNKIVGLAPPSAGLASAGKQITVALGEAHGLAGETISVPVQVDDTAALAAGELSISYDQTVLRAVSVGSDSGLMMTSNLTEPGTIRIAFASLGRPNSRTLAEIKFDVLADAVSPLKLKTVNFYGRDTSPLISRSISREFTSWAIPPEKSVLLQNFPNPFNPETWIPYQLRDAGEVSIRIYSVMGELVRELDLGYKTAGLYISQDRAAHWDGRNKFGMEVASGVYFYSIRSDNFSAVRKLIVLK